jgi:UDP-N-acetylglucosamine--N-acetylmuramyl-(pentapeptide) pyrophosphoryl-undecaprenol N-acetylglucosamine transferase
VSPGLTNRVLGKWAQRVATGFPTKSYQDFSAEKMIYVGNPVREELLKTHRFDGLVKFRLEQNLPVVLVTGGSQGAVAINDVVLDAASMLLDHCQIIHLTGEKDFERVKFEFSRLKLKSAGHYHPFGFLMGDMAKALAAADVVVARAGANTIAELAALGKPTVLIPNYLMAGHQVENAKQLARVGAARVIDEPRLMPALLAGEIDRILESEAEQAALTAAIRAFARPDANQELAKLILSVGAARRRPRPPAAEQPAAPAGE